MATSRHVMLLVVACTLVALFIGSTEAGSCQDSWYRDCDNDSTNGCETYVKNDVYNCGYCGNECTPTWEYAEAYCQHGYCKQRCMHGYYYHHDRCVEHYRHH